MFVFFPALIDGTEADVTDYCTAGRIKDVFRMLLNKKNTN